MKIKPPPEAALLRSIELLPAISFRPRRYQLEAIEAIAKERKITRGSAIRSMLGQALKEAGGRWTK